VARIEKLTANQYELDGIVYDSFLTARRAMVDQMRRRRRERRESRLLVARVQAIGA
jgi:hypothetical protein